MDNTRSETESDMQESMCCTRSKRNTEGLVAVAVIKVVEKE